MNTSDMIDMVDHLYKAENLAQLLCILSDGLRDQPRLANALGEVSNQIVEIVVKTRRDLEAEVEQAAANKLAA